MAKKGAERIQSFDSFKIPKAPKVKSIPEDDKATVGADQPQTTKDVALIITFGNEQVQSIDKILNDLKEQKNVKSFEKKTGAEDGQTTYTIQFSDAYGPYLLGHAQASNKSF
jgi:hypothetical protein